VNGLRPSLFRRPSQEARKRAADEAARAEAFRAAILPHLDGAYTLARYLTRDPELSEDVVQEAFLRAFRGFAQYRGGSARAWLYAIVRNCCRSAISERRVAGLRAVNQSGLSESESAELAGRTEESASPESELIRRDEAAALRATIQSLPEPFREALLLRDVEGLSYREIAEVAAVPVGTVMSRLARGRSMVAELLLPELSEPAERGAG
jgi:RNA polymerase sigma-70 factor (ECF subfamily)